jgi:hypothetical protein
MNSLQDFLGKDWVLYESCEPTTYARGFYIRTFIETNDISYSGIAKSLAKVFDNCPVVIAQHQAIKCENERLKAELKRLEPYETYYKMHKGLLK